MKKIYFYMLVAMTMALASCSDWDSPYYIDNVVGSWVSEYGSDGFGEYDIRGYDVVRYDFYGNYTGRYTFYSNMGLSYVDFDWETRGDRLFIRYYDGDFENLYYGFDSYGYLILSLDSRFHQYTAYRPGSMMTYEPAKSNAADSTARVSKRDTTAKIQSASRATKRRATE